MFNRAMLDRRNLLKATLATGAATSFVPAGVAAGFSPRSQTAPRGRLRQDTTTLEFWSRFDFLQGAIDLYNEEAASSGKNIQVNFTTVPGDQLVNKLTTSLTGNSQPDVMSIDLIQCPYFNSLGAFVDLTDRFNELVYSEEFSPGMMQLGEYEGQQYQIPFAADDSALIWNKDIFEQAGLDPESPPATWDELVEFAVQATSSPDYFGIAFDAQSGGTFMFRWMPFVWANGGSLLSEDGTESTINSPEALEALQLWVDLINEYQTTPPGTHTWNGDDLRGAFQAGKVGMMIGGNFNIALLNRDAPDLSYGTALIPVPEAGGQSASFAGGDMMGILAGNEKVEEAWDLLEFLASEQVQVEYLAQAGIIPVRTSFYENPYFEEEPAYQTFAQALDVARAPWTLKYNRLYDSFQANLQSALAGTMSPEEALERIESDHNEVLAG